jgi:peptidoglycan/LPS O-acetylase OafA/YrhL
MPAKQDIPALTGVRGAASLVVAAYHLLLPAHFITGWPAAILSRGYLAVDLFFVLSGFVMALTYGGLFRALPDMPVLGDFLLRRLARLYPLYAVILLLRFSYTALRYGTFDLPRPWIAAPLAHPAVDLPANLLMIQAWGLSGSSIGTAWSISTEWGAYFLFPALALLLLWSGRKTALASTGAACALIVAVAALDVTQDGVTRALDCWNGCTPGPLMRCIGGFALGMAVFRVSRVPAVAALAGTAWARRAVLLAGACLLAAGAPDLALYPIFPALVLCLATSRDRCVFAHPLMVWLGEISYALYLLHIFLLHPLDVARAGARLILPPFWADILAPSCLFALLLAAAHAAYRHVEKPGRALIMRLGTRWGRQQTRQRTGLVPSLTSNT